MNAAAFENISGVLFDIDGVVHVGDQAIDGAARAIQQLRDHGTSFRFVTNTTTQSRASLHERLRRLGLPIEPDEILTTHEVAARRLRSQGSPTCWLLVADLALPAYAGLPRTEDAPDYVVIGDIGDRWDFELLDRVFNMVMNGSRMIALHKGRFWQTESGLRMDIGCFVAGLEYVTGTRAEVIGKPTAAFFGLALDDMGVQPGEALMVGDDIESDVGGAQRAGLRAALVRTGKYRPDTLERSTVVPDAVLDSVADLPAALGIEPSR